MNLSKNETIMKFTGLAYAVMFLGALCVFVFLPGMMFGTMNELSRALFPSLPLATDSGKFWLSLTVSMMSTITVLSFLIYRDVKANYRMALPLVLAKFSSSFAGLAFFVCGFACPGSGWNTLANLLILFTDFPLGVFMLILYVRVRREIA